MSEVRMHLVYLPTNAAWTFLFGDAPTRLYFPGDQPAPLFFESKTDAIDTAFACGLIVDPRTGKITSVGLEDVCEPTAGEFDPTACECGDGFCEGCRFEE